MDIAAHALWSVILLPGPPTLEKVLFGILPDIAVFIPDLAITAIRGEKRNFKTRKEMMAWYDKPENRWKKELYKWTHSLVLWLFIVGIITFIVYQSEGFIPWFLFAALLHVLLDIPTHTNDSFPVAFLTPFSNFRVNGWHWSNKYMIFGNYFLIIIAFYIRLFLF